MTGEHGLQSRKSCQSCQKKCQLGNETCQIFGYRVWRRLLKDVEKGRIHSVGHPQRWPSTSNAAEWFLRDYERLVYLSKGPFADIESAQKLTGLCVLGYVFRMGLKGQACPLERAQVDVSRIPLYHLINRPKLSKLQELIADQYTDGLSREDTQKQA